MLDSLDCISNGASRGRCYSPSSPHVALKEEFGLKGELHSYYGVFVYNKESEQSGAVVAHGHRIGILLFLQYNLAGLVGDVVVESYVY